MSGTAPQSAGAGPSGGSYVPAQAGGAPGGGAGGNPPQPQPAPPSAQNLNQIVSSIYSLPCLMKSSQSLLTSLHWFYPCLLFEEVSATAGPWMPWMDFCARRVP